MKLNNTSYCHKHIRLLCFQLEKLTELKLVTDLSEEFNQIRFVNSLSYIIVDIKHNACFTLSHALTNKEWQNVREIILYCEWLLTGEKYSKRMQRLAKKKPSSKKN